MTPIPDDELHQAADILNNFRGYWNATGGNLAAQQELIQLIVARVWVRGEQIAAISLRPNYHITLGIENEKPTEITVGSSVNDNIDQDYRILRRERRASTTHLLLNSDRARELHSKRKSDYPTCIRVKLINWPNLSTWSDDVRLFWLSRLKRVFGEDCSAAQDSTFFGEP